MIATSVAPDPTDEAKKGRKQSCMTSTVNYIGFSCIFIIGAIVGFNFKQSAGPHLKPQASSDALTNLIAAPISSGKALLGSENREILDWRDVNTCQLMALGKEHEDDKFYGHIFGDLYCETLIPFRNSRTKLRMLEIGFGCGHHNHGRSAQVWKRYFTENGGPGVSLYEVDYGPNAKHTACVNDFLKAHPDVVEAVYLGDQSDKAFMKDVVHKSGGKFDIIIDDGGHLYYQQKATFEVLWEELAPGGLYFMEDLQVSSSESGMTREILGWADQLASCRQAFCGSMGNKWKTEPTWVKWPTHAPKDMISVHCQTEICVMRKMYPKRLK